MSSFVWWLLHSIENTLVSHTEETALKLEYFN